MIMGSTGSKVTRNTFRDMGDKDCYREAFSMWVVKVTKVRESDHRAKFGIGGRGQVKLQNPIG